MKPIKEIVQFEGKHFIINNGIFTPLRFFYYYMKYHDKYMTALTRTNINPSLRLMLDMLWKRAKYHIKPNDYFLLELGEFPSNEIKNYIENDYEHFYYAWKMNEYKKFFLFKNKYRAYCAYKNYYKRMLLKVDSDKCFREFREFLSVKKEAFIKPINGTLGKGTRVVSFENNEQVQSLFFELRESLPDGFVVEELIRQDSELAKFHPSSVNTVRIVTIRHADYVRIWRTVFRTGIGFSVVDNAGSGGIMALIDQETGILSTAMDKRGNVYVEHPDTKVAFSGFQIPHWQEAMALAKELAQIVPSVPYVGWDLALTDDGWVLVEANWSPQMGYQALEHKGCRRELDGEIKLLRQERR